MFFWSKNPIIWFFLVLFCIAGRVNAEKHIPFGVELGKEISRNIYTGQNLEDLSYSAKKMLKDIL